MSNTSSKEARSSLFDPRNRVNVQDDSDDSTVRMSDGNSGSRLVLGTGSLEAQERLRANFPRTAMMPYSITTTPIELYFTAEATRAVSRGTGFFWRFGGAVWLVTNYHVLSGLNVFTGEQVGKCRPGHIRFYPPSGCSIGDDAEGREILTLSRHSMFVTLPENYQDALRMPVMIDDVRVDIAGVPLNAAQFDELSAFRHPNVTGLSAVLNDHPEQEISSYPGDDIFILGYPYSNKDGLMTPVWKRGTLASDLQVGVNEEPYFLIDAATREGMSGSPILQVKTINFQAAPAVNGIEPMYGFRVIGVYGGRMIGAHSQLGDLEMGYGWYRSMIEPTLAVLAERYGC